MISAAVMWVECLLNELQVGTFKEEMTYGDSLQVLGVGRRGEESRW